MSRRSVAPGDRNPGSRTVAQGRRRDGQRPVRSWWRSPAFTLAGPMEKRGLRWALLAATVAYLLSFSTIPVTNSDDQLMLSSAMSFVETGKFTAPSRFAVLPRGGQYFGKQAVTGEVYSKYPVGYPLVLVVFILLARGAGLLFGSTAAEVVLCLPSMLAILGSMVLLWRAAMRLGFGPATANCLAVALALGSYLWPYAGINWSEPVQIFCLVAAFYCLIAARQDESHWRFYTILGGIALGYGILVKATLAVLAPILVLSVFYVWYGHAGLRKALSKAAIFAAPALLASLYLLATNFVLFGNPMDFGYREESFTAPIFEGLRGLTIGWRKGILWFLPICLLAPWGAWKLARSPQKWVAATLSGTVLLHFLLISRWHMYEGGSCWGPRLLLPVVPFMVLLAGAAMDTAWRRWAGWVLVAGGLALNTLGALIEYQVFFGIAGNANVPFEQPDPLFSQISGHFWLLRVESMSLATGKPASEIPLWKQPPWISKYPDFVPAKYPKILNPWPLRLLAYGSGWERHETWLLRVFLEVAIEKYEQKDFRGALRVLDKALAIDPTYKRCVAAKGMVYLSLQDFPRALTHFQRSLELDPQFELGLYGKGMVMEIFGNVKEARAAYRMILTLPPDSLDRADIQARLARLEAVKDAPNR
jgi:tetratricopeptide (TPR) repeat protein